MSELDTIAINDGQDTPVSHNFDPVGPDNDGVFTYVDRSTGIPVGFPSVSLSLSRPNGNSNVYRAKGQVVVPVLEEATGTNPGGYTPGPKVAYVGRSTFEFILPIRSTAAERADLLAYVNNLISHTVVTSMVEDLEAVW